MKLVLESDLCKRQTSGRNFLGWGGGVRWMGCALFLYINTARVDLEKNIYIRPARKRQEKEGTGFSQNEYLLLTYMAVLKDHPNRIQFPQNLLKPKFISYNKKDIVSIIFNIFFS